MFLKTQFQTFFLTKQLPILPYIPYGLTPLSYFQYLWYLGCLHILYFLKQLFQQTQPSQQGPWWQHCFTYPYTVLMIWFFGQPCWSYGSSATLTCSHSYMFCTDTHIIIDLLRLSTETCFCPHPSLYSHLVIWYSCILVCTEPSSKTLTKLSWPLNPYPLPQTYDACQTICSI